MSVSTNNNPGSWTQVNGGRPVLTSTVGQRGVRDPSIIRSRDGSKFWIIATDLRVYPRGWDVGDEYTTRGSHGIVVWESNDLRTWSQPALRIVSPSNAGMTWAPDAIWDPATSRCEYALVSSRDLVPSFLLVPFVFSQLPLPPPSGSFLGCSESALRCSHERLRQPR